MQALCLPLTSLCNSGHNPRGQAVLANSAAEHRGSGLVWQCPGKAPHLVQGTAEPTAPPQHTALCGGESRAEGGCYMLRCQSTGQDANPAASVNILVQVS